MQICGDKVKQWILFIFASILTVCGIVVLILWGSIYNGLLKSELSISNESMGFKMWKETPITIYLEVYFFNWTNSEQVLKDWSVKPIFEECGPYVFTEHHVRVNLQWNDNDTITYQQKRIFKHVPSLSKPLQDNITNVNAIASTVSYFVRHKNYLIRKAVDFVLREKERDLAITKTVQELLFDGYEDDILKMIHKMNTTIINIPFEKFGWFYSRNESETYDGTFTMYTGRNDFDLLGIMDLWNGHSSTPFYSSYCSLVNGTSGELWPPVKNYKKVSIFASDLCSSLTLVQDDISMIHGVEGIKYVGDKEALDNGTLYPNQGCFSTGDIVPSGTRNVSQCKFGAPAFISYPHFYLADPSYRDAVIGMNPTKDHEFSVVLEPTTGIPLDARAQMQINILVQPIPGIKMFEKVKKTFLPVLWFKNVATLNDEFANKAKILLVLPSVGIYTASGILVLGLFLLGVAAYLAFWRKKDKEQIGLLAQQR